MIGSILMVASLCGAPTTERLALVIANNGSLDEGVDPLRFADDDGARMYELLSAFGYDATLLSVLDRDTAEQHPDARQAARPPSWRRLERTVRDLRNRVAQAHRAGHEVELIIKIKKDVRCLTLAARPSFGHRVSSIQR